MNKTERRALNAKRSQMVLRAQYALASSEVNAHAKTNSDADLQIQTSMSLSDGRIVSHIAVYCDGQCVYESSGEV